MKFKVGDKVKILSKTYTPYEDTQQWIDVRFPNRTGIIKDIISHRNIIVIDDWYFAEHDLELIEEEKMEYKIIKGGYLTLINLMQYSNITVRELSKFITNYVLPHNVISIKSGNLLSPELVKYAQDKPCFIEFLIKNKYIEKVGDKVADKQTYSIRDKFKKEGTIIRLYQVGYPKLMSFIVVKCDNENYVGVSWFGITVKVEDTRNITEGELNTLFGGSRNDWVKI